jgi:pyroglutamyl-peptidase
MRATILITGFGPFPGAPYNPTDPLVGALARRRHPAFAGVRRIAHVFRVSYEAVDRELPQLLARERPDVLVMFGLAMRTKHIRIETRARNALTRTIVDASGRRPAASTIVPDAPASLPLRAPAQRLVMAARATGVPAALSRDAGRYLCNYLCWRAAEAAGAAADQPRIAVFIHVPRVSRVPLPRSRRRGTAITLQDLTRAGEAIVRAALAAARSGQF